MQLVYIWVKNYGCFHEQEFNFYSKHRFKFCKSSNVIKYYDNSDSINEFYKDEKSKNTNNGINNLTVIVGNNGAGKTTLLKLASLNLFSINHSKVDGIFIYLDKHGKFVIYNNLLYEKSENNYIELKVDEHFVGLFNGTRIKSWNIKNEYENNITMNKYLEVLEKNYYIYYSDILTEPTFSNKRFGRVSDISTIALIESDKKSAYENHYKELSADRLVYFFHEDFYRQIRFIFDYKNTKEFIRFKLPEYALVSFANIDPAIDGICRKIDSEYKREQYIDKKRSSFVSKFTKQHLIESIIKVDSIIKNFTSKREDKIDNDEIRQYDFGARIIRGIFTEFIYLLMPGIAGNYDNEYKEIYLIIKSTILDMENNFKNINNLYDSIRNFIISIATLFAVTNGKTRISIGEANIRDFLKCIESFRRYITNKYMERINYYRVDAQFVLKVNDVESQLNEEKKYSDLEEFYEIYKNTAINFNYLEFSWPLSGGENHILSLLARFYSIDQLRENNNKNKIEDIIILIDEGDVTLHPEWQQEYIQILIKFLQDLYEDYPIQLIITTHSPIMISDIPNDNIIYITKNDKGESISITKKEKTFGGNIYDIFHDGFYLKRSSFGIIGLFASSKIEDVQEKLNVWAIEIEKAEENALIEYKEYKKNGRSDILGETDIESIKKRLIQKIDISKKELDECKKTINIVGEDFVRKALLVKFEKIQIKLNNNWKSNELKDVIRKFDDLTLLEREQLVRYIIEKSKDEE
ncbi:hypothetical protein CDLVIII_2411 [Clostridium sp. DL-VIII]|uniref:ATP-binding cassette domain-containing protein n=1 Tax=Clostridium sp. DL-VIII TaxID=641107 RepID=UPI00023AFE89|nr:ABC transporter ATP-binding protein [Clostridium sp. DL-VIII]EHI99056.1 hypothetical protein CDLVIII_2411 [Clostridium sp. DL-VIII]